MMTNFNFWGKDTDKAKWRLQVVELSIQSQIV